MIGLIQQDLKRVLVNALFWVLFATLVVIILLMRFVFPESLEAESHAIGIYTDAQSIQNSAFETFETESELIDWVGDSGSIGIVNRDGAVTFVHTGLSEKTLHATAVQLLTAQEPQQKIEVETRFSEQLSVPFNQRLAPIFICFEALVTGFILAGALMLAEKEEGVIKAFRTSPLRANQYLISKTILFSIIGTLYAFLIAVLSLGFHFNVFLFLLLSFMGAALFSMIGMAFTAFFKDMSSWFFAMSLILGLNMLPAIAYSTPSFAPAWFSLLPSYTLIFAYENILFSGSIGVNAWLQMGIWLLIAYFGSRAIIKRKLLMKRGQA